MVEGKLGSGGAWAYVLTIRGREVPGFLIKNAERARRELWKKLGDQPEETGEPSIPGLGPLGVSEKKNSPFK
jgi:hypothetical protein